MNDKKILQSFNYLRIKIKNYVINISLEYLNTDMVVDKRCRTTDLRLTTNDILILLKK